MKRRVKAARVKKGGEETAVVLSQDDLKYLAGICTNIYAIGSTRYRDIEAHPEWTKYFLAHEVLPGISAMRKMLRRAIVGWGVLEDEPPLPWKPPPLPWKPWKPE